MGRRYTGVQTPPRGRWHATVDARPIRRPIRFLTNRILNELPPRERAALLAAGEVAVLRAGQPFAAAAEPIASAFFPESGVLSYVSEMATGHQVAVAAVGADGLVGAGPLLGISHHAYRVVALLDSHGFRVPSEAVLRAATESEAFRSAALAYVGRQLIELASLVACSRVHSHRQRLARWILMTMDKARESSLRITHDALAQMVGGPRHAVTVALSELRAQGAIAHLRGRIDVLDRSRMIRHACECYAPPEIIAPRWHRR